MYTSSYSKMMFEIIEQITSDKKRNNFMNN